MRQTDECLAFHDPTDGHRLKIHLDPASDPGARDAADVECRAENQRLLYVALTRAKHRCSIVWGAINETEGSPLAVTLHPDREDPAKASDAELRQDLARLMTSSGGAIAVRDLVAGPAPAYLPEDRSSGALAARVFDRDIDRSWRIGSFSALTSGERATAPEAGGRDRDDVEDRAELAQAVEVAAEPVILDAFPRGTKAGLLIHSVLEDHDFACRDPAFLEALVRQKLASYGYAKEGLGAMLVAGIHAMLDTPLDPTGLALRSVTRARRLDELEFVLPVAHGDGARRVSANALADAFAKHAGPEIPASYVERLRGLGFPALRGFLRGFVDLVFEHAGRFYVVDYKSNHLGATPGDYARVRLVPAMAHADYYLQYHLYVVAVDSMAAPALAGLRLRDGLRRRPLSVRARDVAVAPARHGCLRTDRAARSSRRSRRCSMADVLDTVPELASIDREVARGLARMAGETEGAILVATALASRATRQGHVCVDGAWLSAALAGATGDPWPAADGWPAVLERSKLVGGPGDATPLVFDAGALYLRRYFAHETRLADSLRARIGHLDEGLDGALLRDGLDRLFPPTGERDLQRLAALVAVTRRFSIISGGPGTGKTTTVVKILALLAEQARGAGRPRLHILVVAPTGKAAARLGEILRGRRDLAVEAEVRDMIPEEASTIHRALRPLPGSRTRFRHDRSNPLAADVVLVDEASMVDSALMSRLVDAVPPRARLILLGDRNQLASVEAGAILRGPLRSAGRCLLLEGVRATRGGARRRRSADTRRRARGVDHRRLRRPPTAQLAIPSRQRHRLPVGRD